jgi:hypothetical protein
VIRLPQRSVTRFFIPLIDVLTLLFAIFLLMPALQAGAEAQSAGDSDKDILKKREDDLKRRENAATKAEEQLKTEYARLSQDAARKVLSDLVVREVYIDPSDGSLYYLDPDRVEIKTEEGAHAYIRRMHNRTPGREVFFLIRYRRGPTIDKPSGDQLDEYERWFAGEGREFKEDARAKGDKP